MARPSKSVKVMSKNLTKEEKELRLETEEKLKGGADNISPPTHLNARQKKIFNYVVDQLRESNILGNLDIYILSQTSIAIDRLQQIEKLINNDINRIYDKDLIKAKSEYTKDFFRCCNELSLSPQSRAKLGNINMQAKERDEDVLLKVLAGGSK
ncbi:MULTISPECIES: phage terminase small subunit P27 family [Clostridium]|uniref:phage terminase small subunit P27 family n=1 Tax=Clostridium TaxID=1485 RepID=UPI000C06F59F|nr:MULTISPECIES: phage terminase small subunit P27 family [Clostridium]MBP1869338.1 P27 family predicted phage terminase small subunit [Clostridium tertium]MBU6137339.1 phage terminase small subunit P27 family [Clostridium tertium]MDU2683508.1 phage terminase small subunit P27 family [Clostridium sp.]MDU8967575.1 phage terminase small subunit P27 family [Clostridium sp.]